MASITRSTVPTQLQTILTAGGWSTDTADLATYVSANPILPPAQPPSYILRPGNAGELQAVIRYVNEVGLNLTVASSSGPHEMGGICSQEENILIDLSHWRQIDLIDRRNRVCRIEPGVTYGQLLARLEQVGLTLPMPLAPRRGKSVLAAVMDREPSTWPNKQWDSSDPVGSTEFFFGDGQRFRSGAAGGPGTIQQQRAAGGALKFSSGPSQTDFHRVVQGAQGTMGLVSWITLRAELKPALEESFLIGADRLEDLIPFVYDVQRGLLGEQTLILDRTALALLMAGDDRSAFATIQASLPGYLCLQNVAGFERLPQERLAFHKHDINHIAGRHNLKLEPAIGIAAADLSSKASQSEGELNWRHAMRGNCLAIFFQTTLDRSPAFAEDFIEIAADFGLAETDIGTYIQPLVQNHSCHMELLAPFDPRSTDEVGRMRQLETEAVPRFMEMGAFFSRPYGRAAELVWAQNPINTQLLKGIKGLFDPNRVLQRGKWNL